MPVDTKDDEPTPPGRPIKLTAWQRVGAVASGATFAGAGGWAEIASGHDGAGTVAFVAAGALLAGLGIIGRVPSRISGRDYSVEMSDTDADRIVHGLSPTQIASLLDRTDDPALIKAGAQALAFEFACLKAVERAWMLTGGSKSQIHLSGFSSFSDSNLDLVVEPGPSCLMHVMSRERLSQDDVRWFLGFLGRVSEQETMVARTQPVRHTVIAGVFICRETVGALDVSGANLTIFRLQDGVDHLSRTLATISKELVAL